MWCHLLFLTIISVRCQALLDAWFPLWPLVFQPAIGVLMLGAVRLTLVPLLMHAHSLCGVQLRHFETCNCEHQHKLLPR